MTDGSFNPRTLLDCRHIRMCKADGYRGYEFVTLHLYRGRGREKQPLKAACYLLPKQMVLWKRKGRPMIFWNN